MESEYQILNLVEMMDRVSLQEISRTILCDSPKSKKSEDIETSSNFSERTEAPLMLFPEHINDHYKISWMIKDNTPVELLMSGSFPMQDDYLNQYFRLISRKNSPFSFVQVYPHSLHLKSNRRFKRGQDVIEIDSNWFLSKREFVQTRICKYLRMLTRNIQQNVDIFEESNKSSDIIRNVDACSYFKDSFYLFQLMFVVDICNMPPPTNAYQRSQWLFFKLLPKSVDHLPLNHLEIVQKYHRIIGESLDNQRIDIMRTFEAFKSIVYGKGIKPEYQFREYLKKAEIHGNGLVFYERYLAALTIENYVWARCNERIKIYHEENSYRPYARTTTPSEVFIPILDIFHHSSNKPNINWYYDPISQSIKVTALEDIECGQIISTYFNNMDIQFEYNYYGFVDVNSQSRVEVPLYYDHCIIVAIIEAKINCKLNSELRKFVFQVLENDKISYVPMRFCSSDELLSTAENLLADLNYRTLVKLTQVAQKLYSILFRTTNFMREESYHKKDRHMKKHNRSLFSLSSLKRDMDLMKKISRNIMSSIEENIRVKRRAIQEIQDELRRPYIFNVEYNLMCMHTLIYSELSLLLKVKESIFSINKVEQMALE